MTTVLADDEMTPWRVVVPGAWRRQYAVSGAARSGSVLPEGDDDVVAEGLELAVRVAGLAAAVGVPGVPVGTEVAAATRQAIPPGPAATGRKPSPLTPASAPLKPTSSAPSSPPIAPDESPAGPKTIPPLSRRSTRPEEVPRT